MCTVTYLPTNGGYFLTSNRDEQVHRPTLKPALYCSETGKWIYPKDAVAGGSWIAAGESKSRCLLNGALENHLPKTRTYTKSRGQILKDSLAYVNDYQFIERVDLTETEPFTLLLFDHKNDIHYLELKWDGTRKHVHEHAKNQPKIWSSVTLYNNEVIENRKQWFNEWLKSDVLQADDMLKFHLFNHSEHQTENILMERNNGQLKTVSISQIVNYKSKSYFKYLDLLDPKNELINTKLNPLELCVQDGQ